MQTEKLVRILKNREGNTEPTSICQRYAIQQENPEESLETPHHFKIMIEESNKVIRHKINSQK